MSVDVSLSGRIALVTGASRGIGRSAAIALARAGAHVVATARTEGALTELDDEVRAATGESVTLVPAKLENGGGLDRMGAALYERYGRLDILVHAAAQLGPLTPVAHMDVRDWEKTMTVNLTATFRLIRSLDPLLRASDGGRPIFVSSGAARRPQAYWGAYGVSKAAMEMLIQTYAEETDHTPIRPVLVDPGPMRTEMRAQAFPGEDPATLPHPDEIGPLVVKLADPTRQPPGHVRFRDWRDARG